MPTISDLKDQARALEQQGQIDKALNIYQHILKHLEGNPAITKVLPLYVKAGDLLLKMDRTEEAVTSYQAAAEHYASTGAATRVTALCEKILRLAPERTDVYTSFVRLLIEHEHVGSARDVLAAYAQIANMDRAVETLNDLAGRPNSEVQPMLERLLDSFELEEQDEQAAERVSTHLEQVTDDLAGELTGVPEEDEPPEEEKEEPVAEEPAEDVEDGPEEEPEEDVQEEVEAEPDPLGSHLLDLDRMPRQSTILGAVADDDLDDMTDADEGDSDIEQTPEPAITTDVTPTMESATVVTRQEYEDSTEDGTTDMDDEEEEGAGLLLAESITPEEAAKVTDTTEPEDAVEIERSGWTPDYPDQSAEETVASEWSAEEELQPAARYPSDEYDTPAEIEEETEEDAAEGAELAKADELDDAVTRAVEESEAFATVAAEPDLPAETAVSTEEEPPTPQVEPEPEPEPTQRPSRPPRVMMPEESETEPKSPVLFGVGGFVVGMLAGAGLTFVLVGGGSDGPPPTVPVEQPAVVVDTPVAVTETPAEPELEAQDLPQTTTDSIIPETTAVDSSAESAADSTEAVPAEEAAPDTTEETDPDTTAVDVAAEQDAAPIATAGYPIIVEGMEIDEFSEVEAGGRSGFRVVHLLDWADPLVIEAYRDTSVTMSTFIQVTVTQPDTVVGIRRLDGYMVYASGVMPEDSLRSLMTRLVEGERPPN